VTDRVVGKRAVIVGSDGRAKVYRPLPEDQRRIAIEAGLAAYARGEFFDAHEELEPAWMGSADPAERSLLQGLIKVAAAYVHHDRGNPAGIERNLVGARRLLAEAAAGLGDGPNAAGVDVDALLAAVDLRLADLTAHPDSTTLGAPPLVAAGPSMQEDHAR
jgi:predicted metal-dependent hydrolase